MNLKGTESYYGIHMPEWLHSKEWMDKHAHVAQVQRNIDAYLGADKSTKQRLFMMKKLIDVYNLVCGILAPLVWNTTHLYMDAKDDKPHIFNGETSVIGKSMYADEDVKKQVKIVAHLCWRASSLSLSAAELVDALQTLKVVDLPAPMAVPAAPRPISRMAIPRLVAVPAAPRMAAPLRARRIAAAIRTKRGRSKTSKSRRSTSRRAVSKSRKAAPSRSRSRRRRVSPRRRR